MTHSRSAALRQSKTLYAPPYETPPPEILRARHIEQRHGTPPATSRLLAELYAASVPETWRGRA